MLMLAPGISEQSYDSWGLGVVLTHPNTYPMLL